MVARAIVRAHNPAREGDLSAPGGLAAACHDIPALADLFRLAARPEYADARWHPVPPVSRRPASTKVRVL
jgi:hypothetical protein